MADGEVIGDAGDGFGRERGVTGGENVGACI